MKYKVTMLVTRNEDYLVEAASEDEAIDLVYAGFGDLLDSSDTEFEFESIEEEDNGESNLCVG